MHRSHVDWRHRRGAEEYFGAPVPDPPAAPAPPDFGAVLCAAARLNGNWPEPGKRRQRGRNRHDQHCDSFSL